MTDLFSVKDVAKLFSLAEARLRYWAQTGFVGPSVRRGGRAYYTFEDLIGVKVAKELLDGGLPLQRVRRNLDALRAALPDVERPLTRLRVCSDGDKVVVQGQDVAYEPASGQLLLSFAVASLTSQVAEVLLLPTGAAARSTPRVDVPPASAYATFLTGLTAEDEGKDEEAEVLYRCAIKADDRFAAAWTNLGNVLSRRGARGQAREAYETALALDPEQPEARYNLANLLCDLGENDLALAEYRHVATICPEFADAHYNLGLLYARLGTRTQARNHLLRYLELDTDSDWAARARDFLETL